MRRLAAALAASAVAVGCGGDPGDLLSIDVAGGPAGGRHSIVVSGDGRGSCDRRALKQLPADRVLDARGIARDLGDLARRAAVYPPRSGARRYGLSTRDGVVRWSEGTPGLPEVLPRTQLLALQLERLLCR